MEEIMKSTRVNEEKSLWSNEIEDNKLNSWNKKITLKKIKKQVKRNYTNSVSCYNHSFAYFSWDSFKFNNRTKWNI